MITGKGFRPKHTVNEYLSLSVAQNIRAVVYRAGSGTAPCSGTEFASLGIETTVPVAFRGYLNDPESSRLVFETISAGLSFRASVTVASSPDLPD